MLPGVIMICRCIVKSNDSCLIHKFDNIKLVGVGILPLGINLLSILYEFYASF